MSQGFATRRHLRIVHKVDPEDDQRGKIGLPGSGMLIWAFVGAVMWTCLVLIGYGAAKIAGVL